MALEVIEISEMETGHGSLQKDQSFSSQKDKEVCIEEINFNDDAMCSRENNPEDFPDGGFEAYVVIFGAFCGLLSGYGVPNSIGAIEAYVTKNQLEGYKPSTVSWIFSLHLGIMCLGGVFSGPVFDRYGAKKLLISGTVFMFVGLMTTAESKQLYHFILSFGVLTAIGSSLAMAPLIGVVSHWFLKKRALACSMVTLGGPVGSAVFVIMLQKLYRQVGYKWAIRILAFICLGCMTVSIFLVKGRVLEPINDNDMESGSAQKSDSDSPIFTTGTLTTEPGCPPGKEKDISFWDQLSTSLALGLAPFLDVRFVSLTVGVILSALNSMTILTYLASFASAGGVPEKQSYLLLTIVNLCSIPARVVTGFLADKYGRFNAMLGTSLLSALFIWVILLPSKCRLSYLYAFSVLYGMLNSTVYGLIAACLGQICPAKSFGKHYGLLYFCLAFFVVFGFYVTSLVINNESDRDYRMWIIFEGCISIVCVAAWFWARWCNVSFRLCKF